MAHLSLTLCCFPSLLPGLDHLVCLLTGDLEEWETFGFESGELHSSHDFLYLKAM